MRNVTVVRALNEAIAEEMARDEAVFVIGEDVADAGGVFGVTAGMLKRFGRERVRQTPICEAAFTGLAVGAAMAGLRPICEIMYVDFATTCMDQILNQAAKLRQMSGGQVSVPLVVRTQQGGGTCEAAQHSQCLEAIFAHVPGLKVVAPWSPADHKGLLKSAIRDDNPVIFLEHKLLYETKGELPRDEFLVPLGEALVRREGSDVTVVAWSLMVGKALAAAEAVADEVSVEVIDLRTLVPLDFAAIAASVRRTGRLVVAQEACLNGGFGGEVVRRVCAECLDALVAAPLVVGGADVPMPFSPALEAAVLPDEEDIIAAINATIA